MSLNKKMIRNAVIAVLALALLGAGYYFAVRWQPQENEQTENRYESISVYSVEEKQISKIVYKNGNETFSIVRKGEGTETQWSIPEKKNIEFSQNKLQSGIYNLTSMSASQKLGDKSGSLAEYGLDKADKTVTLYTGNGEITIILGDKVAVDSSYYLMKKGENMVYTVSDYTADSILKTPNDFRETTLAEINPTDITALEIKHGSERIMEFDKAQQTQDNELQMASLVMTYPYAESVRVEPLNEMLSVFTGVQVIDFISDNMEDSTKYGLDKGWSIAIKTGEQTHNIRFGNADQNGNLYATYNDCGFIFTMSPAIQNTFKDIKPFDLVDKFAHIYMIDQIKSIAVEIGGSLHTLSIEGEGEKHVYKVDGKTATEDAFKGMYQIIVGRMVTDTVKNEALKGAEVARITFDMVDGKRHTAKYFEYDDRSYMVERPDGKKYLMLRKYVDEMQKNLENFAKNPSERPQID